MMAHPCNSEIYKARPDMATATLTAPPAAA